MDEYISFGVEVRRLFAAFHVCHLGQQDFQQAACVEQIKASDARGMGENFHQFVAEAFRAYDRDLWRHVANGFPCFLFDLETEGCAEANAADEAQFVFGKTLLRVPDTAEDACLQICFATDMVDDPFFYGIVEKAVDCEVTPLGIAFGCCEGNRLWMSAVLVSAVRAEGGYLKFEVVLKHDNHAECGPHRHCAGEEALHLLGLGTGGDVNVVSFLAEKHIANAATGEERLVPGRSQALDQARGSGFHRGLLQSCPDTVDIIIVLEGL